MRQLGALPAARHGPTRSWRVVGVAVLATAGLVALWRVGRSDSSPPRSPEQSQPQERGQDDDLLVAGSVPSSTSTREEIDPSPSGIDGALEHEPAHLALGGILIWVTWEENGQPAADIGLRLSPHSADWMTETVLLTPDDSGRAAVKSISPGGWTIHAAIGGFQRTEIQPGENNKVHFSISRGPTLDGRVVDFEGSPVAEAVVWLSRTYGDCRQVPAGVTDSSGGFSLPALGSANYLGARAEGYAPSPSYRLAGPGVLTVPDLTVVLPARGGGVTGVVLDPDGGQVPGALVEIEIAGRNALEHGAYGSHGRTPPLCLTTDQNGHFRVASVEAGLRTLAVRESSVGSWSGSVHVQTGEFAHVEVTLRSGFSVTGVVTDEEGQPVEGAIITTGPNMGISLVSTRIATSSKDGTYRLSHVEPGSIDAHATKLDVGEDSVQLEGQEGVLIQWNPTLRSEGCIAGTLVDHAGIPLEKWTVGITKSDWSSGCLTDPAGQFRIQCLKKGPHTLVAYPPQDMWPAVTVEHVAPTIESLWVVVPEDQTPTRYITGVLGAPAWADVERFHLTVTRLAEGSYDSPGGDYSSNPESSGSFKLGPFRAGTFGLWCSGPRIGLHYLGRHEIGADLTTDLGLLPISAPARLQVTVSGPVSTGVARIYVRQGMAEHVKGTTLIQQGMGHYTSPLLGPGPYEVIVSVPRVARGSSSATLTSGKNEEVTVVLEAPEHVPPPPPDKR